MGGGLLDFERLTSANIIEWLDGSSYWPVGMPHTLQLAELGLTESELELARDRLEKGRLEDRRKAEYIYIDGKSYSTSDDDLQSLVDAVITAISPDFLAAPIEPTNLSDIDSVHRRPGVTPTKPPGGSRGGRQRLSPEKTSAIGFVGELAASLWIKQHYGVSLNDCWVSGY
jgi:hypothetical protein